MSRPAVKAAFHAEKKIISAVDARLQSDELYGWVVTVAVKTSSSNSVCRLVFNGQVAVENHLVAFRNRSTA